VAQAIPLTIAQLVHLLYNVVDRIYLGHMGDGNSMALTGVGLTFPVVSLIMAVTALFGVGGVPLFSIERGAGNDEKASRILGNAFALLLCSSLVLMAVGYSFMKPILFAFGASEESFVFAKQYLNIYLLGTVFSMLTTGLNGYINAQGFPRIGMLSVVIGAVCNIILDPIFIFVLDMGIAGAAWATVIATAMQMLVLNGLAEFDIRKRGLVSGSCKAVAAKILRFGTPSGLYSVVNCLSFTIFVFVTGGVGEFELAVSNACFTVNYLLFAPMEGFALGASTLVAQAIGAKDLSQARRSARKTVFMGVAITAVFSIAAVIFARPILSVFAMKAGERAEDFIALGRILFLVMAAWQIFDAADIVLSGALKGAGDTKFVMGWMCVCVILWLPMVFVVKHVHNTMPALWATQVGYVVLILVGSLVRWYRGAWERRLSS
jgi:putative MATE family efflux protein